MGRIGVGEVEVLDLRQAAKKVNAAVAGPVERPPQHVAGTALERRAVEVDDVAEHPGHLGLGGGSRRPVPVPGEQLEGIGVRPGQHVALLDTAETVDGRSVERHALVECVLQLRRGDAEGLRGPEDVGEPELDEPDAALSTVRRTYSS